MIAMLIGTGAVIVLVAGIAIWAARGDFYDDQELNESREIQELRDAADGFVLYGDVLPIADEPWPVGTASVLLTDMDGRRWEFARVDAQIHVREVQPNDQEPR